MDSTKINTSFFLSVVLIIISVFSLGWEFHREKVCTDYVTAVIVDIDRKTSKSLGDSTKYRVNINYSYNGKSYGGYGKLVRQKPPYNVKDKITIKVNPANPWDYYFPYESKYAENSILLVTGVLWLIMTFVAKLANKNKKDDYY